jgi:hypothetical protein
VRNRVKFRVVEHININNKRVKCGSGDSLCLGFSCCHVIEIHATGNALMNSGVPLQKKSKI